MWSAKRKSSLSRGLFVAIVACVVIVVVVTQLNDVAPNEPTATAELLSTTSTSSWDACLDTLSKAEPKDSLLNTYPISSDAFIARENNDLKLRDLESSQTSESASVLSMLADTIKPDAPHKTLVLGDTAYLMFSNNLVVTADIPSCTIESVHFPQQNGEVHSDLASTINQNRELVRQDKGPTPPPTPRSPNRPQIPCTIRGTPTGCAPRIKKWDQIKNHPLCRSGSKTFIGPHTPGCASFANHDRIRSNLCNRKQYCVQFSQGKHGQKYGIIMQAGESWGKNPINTNGDYDCMGRCGPACNGLVPGITFCSNWGRQCLRHDVCGWFFGSGDKGWNLLLADPNCGDETFYAGRDQFNNCLFGSKPCKGPHKQVTKCPRIPSPQPTRRPLPVLTGRIPLSKFYRYWNGRDHFYTTNVHEIGTTRPGQRGKHGYVSEGYVGYISKRLARNLVPLFRYLNSGGNHFYTTNRNEIGTTTPGHGGKHGYVSEGIAGYCAPRRVPGSIPLYRYHNGGIGDHFYTQNFGELGRGKNGWTYEGIACYIWRRSSTVVR